MIGQGSHIPPDEPKERDGNSTPITERMEPTVEGQLPTTVTIRRVAKVQRREAIVGWTQVIANILVPVTLSIAVWGLWKDNQRQQIDASTRQIELFFTQSLGDARHVLFELWDQTDLSILSVPRPRSFIDEFVEGVIEAEGDNARAVSAAIVNLASYFDRVEVCIERGRCDEAEVLSHVGDYGRDFYCLYAGQLEASRQDTLLFSIGRRAERLAERVGGCGE